MPIPREAHAAFRAGDPERRRLPSRVAGIRPDRPIRIARVHGGGARDRMGLRIPTPAREAPMFWPSRAPGGADRPNPPRAAGMTSGDPAEIPRALL